MKKRLLISICIAFAISVCGPIPKIYAQAQSEVTVVVQFSSGQSMTVPNLSDHIGLQPNQTVRIIVQLSADVAGQTLTIESLDGGTIVEGKSSALVGDDGSLRFGFKAGGLSGHYQVVLRNNAREIGLHFWVLDIANPQNNPPVLTPQ